MQIGVIGAGTCSPEAASLAYDVGRLIAQNSAILVCGGLGGVMEHASRGARDAGGLTVGILPGNTPNVANPWVDIPIATGLGEARNAIIARCAAGVIAVGGGYGTLSEIALALKWGKNVVGLGSWSTAQDGDTDWELIPASTAGEAVRLVLQPDGD